MRFARASRRTVGSALCLALALPVTVMSSSAALGAPGYTGTLIPGFVEEPTDMVAADGRVYISEHYAGDVAVISSSGTLLHTIADLGRARDVEVVQDVLYVADPANAEIARFDISSGGAPVEITAIDTAAVTLTPSSLAVADGDLWFADCAEDTFSMGRVDLPSGTVTDQTPTGEDVVITSQCGRLHASSEAPGQLIFTHGYDAFRFDISTGSAVFEVADPWMAGVINGGHAVLMPDGLSLATRSGPGTLSTYSVDDFVGPDESYTAETLPYNIGAAYATSTAGPGYLVSSSTSGSTGIWLWRADQSASLRRWTLEDDEGDLMVAIDAAATRVFGAGYDDGQGLRFYSLSVTSKPTTLTVGAKPRTVDFGEAVTLRATIDPPSKGRVVSFYATDLDDQRRKIGEATTNSDGIASLLFKPPSFRDVQAVFEGDAGYEASESEIDAVNVRTSVEGSLRRSYGKSGRYRLYHDDRVVLYTVRVRPNRAGDEVTFDLQRKTSGGWRSIADVTVKLSSRSTAGVFVRGGVLKKGAYRMRGYIDTDNNGLLFGSSAFSYLRVTA